MKKVLIAVPTKDRPDMVREVLEYELPYYKNFNIDICYIDSSESDNTQEVIISLSKKYDKDIIYMTKSPRLCLDYKLVDVFKDFQAMEYDYYWLINDSISISEEMLNYVMKIVDDGYDLIRLPLAGSGNKEDFITNDVDEWFQKCSASMAHMASTIMSKALLEGNIDWDNLRKKYVNNNELDEKHGYFFTVGFYLEQIAKLDDFKGIFIGNRFKWRRDCPLKREKSYWQDKVFETWAKSYTETILNLPNIYKNKEDVIRQSDNIRVGRFSKENLIHYRISGLYDVDTYKKYKKYLKYVTDEKQSTCEKIAKTSIEELKKNYPNYIKVEDSWEEKLDLIENKLVNKNIYIYGAGLYGERVVNKLICDGYSKRVKGVVVTESGINITSLLGKPVLGIDNTNFELDDYIILSALPKTAESMKRELDKRNIKNYIGLFDV